MNQQQKNITKTVVIIILIMMAFLAMFLNKMTTPRYLSNIELRINGLILFKDPQLSVDLNHTNWVLLVDNAEKKDIAEKLYDTVRSKLRNQLLIIDQSTLNVSLLSALTLKEKTIPIFDATGLYRGYLMEPYELNKMKLTLSSVMTHR